MNSKESRRGWTMLALILAVLSFDEISSLHEFVANGELTNLIPFGIVGVLFLIATFQHLIKGGTSPSIIRVMFVAFVLLATIPIQEYLQHAIEWNSKISYGIRAIVEEGTEIGAALIILAAVRENMLGANARLQLHESSIVIRFRRQILVVALGLLPATVVGSFLLPHPGGPADWLAAALFVFCALSAASNIRKGGRRKAQPLVAMAIVYLVASAITNAAKLIYVPTIADASISVRGICFSLILIGVIPFMRSAGRNPPAIWLTLCAAAVLVAAFLPEVQWLWRTIPPTVALIVFYLESIPRVQVTVRTRARMPGLDMSN